ncbi:hypothetical protein FH972_014878 [Carpinus fangiana]|uniref:Uncharacterized protein n=1 Tax=Carpinus fangiana TaxID=176857 RepID=A0A5N6RC39_9ROSI|nr:hypothetical protein FH972_014878 [Carpinus fangiana]
MGGRGPRRKPKAWGGRERWWLVGVAGIVDLSSWCGRLRCKGWSSPIYCSAWALASPPVAGCISGLPWVGVAGAFGGGSG